MTNAEAVMWHYDEAAAAFVEGKPVAPDPLLPEGVKQLLRALSVPVNLLFARELWSYDPCEYIGRVREPILVVIGKKDMQVDWREDGRALEKATEKGKASFVYPENADHVLKYEGAPRSGLAANVSLHLNDEDRVLDGDSLNAIYDWWLGIA